MHFVYTTLQEMSNSKQYWLGCKLPDTAATSASLIFTEQQKCLTDQTMGSMQMREYFSEEK